MNKALADRCREIIPKKAYLIFWHDTVGNPGWTDKEEFDKWSWEDDGICLAIGFLNRKNDLWTVLYDGVHSDEVGNATKIPNSAVIHVQEVSIKLKPNTRTVIPTTTKKKK